VSLLDEQRRNYLQSVTRRARLMNTPEGREIINALRQMMEDERNEHEAGPERIGGISIEQIAIDAVWFRARQGLLKNIIAMFETAPGEALETAQELAELEGDD